MANILKWTDRAIDEYGKLANYLYNEWGDEIATRVIHEINQTVSRIGQSPEQFPIYIKRRRIRRCVASPQTSIYFTVKAEWIEILSVYDNRQNPKKPKL